MTRAGLAPEPTERYIGTELELVLGKSSTGDAPLQGCVSVAAYRVPVQRGHLVDIRCNVLGDAPADVEAVHRALEAFDPLAAVRASGAMPSCGTAPPIQVERGAGAPRPRSHAGGEGDTLEGAGLGVVAGNVKLDDGVWDVCLTVCVDNVAKGAWAAALQLLEYHTFLNAAPLEVVKAAEPLPPAMPVCVVDHIELASLGSGGVDAEDGGKRRRASLGKRRAEGEVAEEQTDKRWWQGFLMLSGDDDGW